MSDLTSPDPRPLTLAALLTDLFPSPERARWPFSVEQAADALTAAGVSLAAPALDAERATRAGTPEEAKNERFWRLRAESAEHNLDVMNGDMQRLMAGRAAREGDGLREAHNHECLGIGPYGNHSSCSCAHHRAAPRERHHKPDVTPLGTSCIECGDPWPCERAPREGLRETIDKACDDHLGRMGSSEPFTSDGYRWQGIAAYNILRSAIGKPTIPQPAEPPERAPREGEPHPDAGVEGRNHYAWFMPADPTAAVDGYLDDFEAKMVEALTDPFVHDMAQSVLPLIAAYRAERAAPAGTPKDRQGPPNLGDGLREHHGEPHEFDAACRRCGVPGHVVITILGDDEALERVPRCSGTHQFDADGRSMCPVHELCGAPVGTYDGVEGGRPWCVSPCPHRDPAPTPDPD